MTKVINNHYVIEPESVEQFKAIFPEAKVACVEGKTYAAVPSTIDRAQVLQNLGYSVQSPIRWDYDWPGKYKPYDHQIETAEFCTLNRRGFVLNSMRTGKTMSCLWASDIMMRQGDVGSALIVSPLSTLERVWGDELFWNFPDRTFNVLHGSAAKRKALLAEQKDFYIINHHGVKIIEEILAERPDINLVIIDEVAVFRNKQTGLWKSLNRVCNVQMNRMVWGLTGTPMPNEPTDVYGQMKLVKPENFSGSFTRLKQLIMHQITQYRWVPRKFMDCNMNGVQVHSAVEAANALLKPSIRFERDVVSSMEPCIIERQAELSPQQKIHYNDLLKEACTEIGESQVTAVNAAVLAGKLVQAATGCLYDSNGNVLEIDFGPRIKVLKELIAENNEKVIVFAPLRGVLKALCRELEDDYSVAKIDGDVAATKRNRIFQDFQNKPDPHVLVAHPETMAHGLDLTAASLIIWYAPTNKNEVFNQANARIDGSKQKVKQDIAMISATPAERAIYATLQGKTRLQDAMLDLAKTIK